MPVTCRPGPLRPKPGVMGGAVPKLRPDTRLSSGSAAQLIPASPSILRATWAVSLSRLVLLAVAAVLAPVPCKLRLTRPIGSSPTWDEATLQQP